jgi:glycosyltransferase involved in cell wall biosynthesis
VCVGRLSEQKGQDVLLRAWPAVRARVPTARLALVGDGPWRERLRAVADDHVLFAGNSADPRDWYASSDVVVVPSRWEGMALVPLEAGASARSVVITDVPGARDAVPPGAGEVVPIGDAAPLSTAVARRLASPRLAASEGERARLQVERHFSVALTGDRMRAVYAEALGIASVP